MLKYQTNVDKDTRTLQHNKRTQPLGLHDRIVDWFVKLVWRRWWGVASAELTKLCGILRSMRSFYLRWCTISVCKCAASFSLQLHSFHPIFTQKRRQMNWCHVPHIRNCGGTPGEVVCLSSATTADKQSLIVVDDIHPNLQNVLVEVLLLQMEMMITTTHYTTYEKLTKMNG